MAKLTINEIEVRGKRCLVRVDYNVPQDESGAITDDNRIAATIPTVQNLLTRGAKVILMSHLGRPKGLFNPKLTLAPAAKRLSELLGKPVQLAADAVGESANELIASMQAGDVIMLENLRFYAEEEANEPEFCKKLAAFADVYVNDAFGATHRAHASTVGVAAFVPVCVCGLLVEKELTFLDDALQNPARPFVAILGGSKVSDKIGVINNLLGKVDALLIGGGMAYTFSKAKGGTIGTSICEDDKIPLALQLLAKAKAAGVKMVLPVDNVVAAAFSNGAERRVVKSDEIPENFMGMDIGPETVKIFSEVIKTAKTIVWNGPVGVFEMPNFAAGTFAMAKAVAESGAVSVIGGGDSAAAVAEGGYADKITHISTGGGASLEYLEGKKLPGIECLNDK